MTNQPKWKFVVNLGDKHPIENDGYFVYIDETGVYQPECEYWNGHHAYRFSLDKCELYDGKLIPFGFTEKREFLPFSLENYEEWFSEKIQDICSAHSIPEQELKRWFCSDDVSLRASTYIMIGQTFGFENLDQCPIKLTIPEAKRRYKKELRLL